jgi:hypothetical protein
MLTLKLIAVVAGLGACASMLLTTSGLELVYTLLVGLFA